MKRDRFASGSEQQQHLGRAERQSDLFHGEEVMESIALKAAQQSQFAMRLAASAVGDYQVATRCGIPTALSASTR